MRDKGRHRRDMPWLGTPAMPDDSVDLDAVHTDDALIKDLLAGAPRDPKAWPGSSPDEQLAAMVKAWRADLQAKPVPELVSVERALAVIAKARSRQRLVRLAAAVAVLVLACSAIAIGGAGTAHPGDPLWGMSRVIHSERANSVEAAVQVRTRLLAIRAALLRGHTDVAARELAAIQAALPAVRKEEGRDELAAELRVLEAKLHDTAAGTPSRSGGLPSDGTHGDPTRTQAQSPKRATGAPTRTERQAQNSTSEPLSRPTASPPAGPRESETAESSPLESARPGSAARDRGRWGSAARGSAALQAAPATSSMVAATPSTPSAEESDHEPSTLRVRIPGASSTPPLPPGAARAASDPPTKAKHVSLPRARDLCDRHQPGRARKAQVPDHRRGKLEMTRARR